MAAIAARTHRIRIGSAGVMLPHYAALKVAEQFRVLDALAPGRIDLGVGRAPGSDMRTAMALNPNAAHAADAVSAAGGGPAGLDPRPAPPGHLGAPAAAGRRQRRRRRPKSGSWAARTTARSWRRTWACRMLSPTSSWTARAAKKRWTCTGGLYQPSERHPTPQPTICVWALAADTADEARHHALSRDRWRLDRQRGLLGPLRTPASIAEQGFTDDERPAVAATQAKAFVGTAAEVGAQLRALARALELDELVINTWAHAPAVRRQSYALLAREFALTA